MLWLMLSYLWVFLFLLPLPAVVLLFEEEDSFVKWHARHGLILAVIWFAISVATLMLANLVGLIWGGVQIFLYLVWLMMGVIVVTVCLIGLYKAVHGQRWSPRLLSDLVDRLGF